jgi:hypothetical protein
MPGAASNRKKRKLSGLAITGIIVGAVVAALLLLAAVMLCARSQRRSGAREGPKGTTVAAAGQTKAPPGSGDGTGMTTSSSKDDMGGMSGSAAAAAVAAVGASTGEPSRLVFLGKGAGYNFDLEDLLRASAEVLGKGSVGTSYKAVPALSQPLKEEHRGFLLRVLLSTPPDAVAACLPPGKEGDRTGASPRQDQQEEAPGRSGFSPPGRQLFGKAGPASRGRRLADRRCRPSGGPPMRGGARRPSGKASARVGPAQAIG